MGSQEFAWGRDTCEEPGGWKLAQALHCAVSLLRSAVLAYARLLRGAGSSPSIRVQRTPHLVAPQSDPNPHCLVVCRSRCRCPSSRSSLPLPSSALPRLSSHQRPATPLPVGGWGTAACSVELRCGCIAYAGARRQAAGSGGAPAAASLHMKGCACSALL